MSLSVSYFMNRYYTGNRFAAKSDMRAGRSARTLADADMQALRSCLKDLRQYDFASMEKEEDADTSELEKRVEAFVSTYNNFVDSAGELDDVSVNRSLKKVKKLSQEQEEAFAKIGITVQSSGKLKLDKDTLKEAGVRKIKNVFSNETDYGTELERQIKRTYNLIRQRNIGIPAQKRAETVLPSQPGTETDPDIGEGKEPEVDPDAGEGENPGVGTDPDAEEQEAKLYEQALAAISGGRINYSI